MPRSNSHPSLQPGMRAFLASMESQSDAPDAAVPVPAASNLRTLLRLPSNNNSSHSAGSISGFVSPAPCCGDRLDKLMTANKIWSAEQRKADPHYFERLCAMQAPEFMWIGCADSRVPANVIMGLLPGEVFVQRNVGNQATHVDLNCMACLEYAVKELKVKVIIVCGHHGCGAVKAALRMPSKTSSLVNCWISDIRECRNQHEEELRALSPSAQVDRLVELNVMRQTFHVCTSHVVQAAWDQGQELEVYGVVYSLKDGLVNRLVGPFASETAFDHDKLVFERAASVINPRDGTHRRMMRVSSASNLSGGTLVTEDHAQNLMDTAMLGNKMSQHVAWSETVDSPHGAAAPLVTLQRGISSLPEESEMP